MKILIISSNLIGDTVLSTGIVNYFYQKYPRAKFTFLIGPSAGQIYTNFPAKKRIILINKKKFNLHWVDMYFKVCRIDWNIIIDFRSSLISYFLTKHKKYIFKKKKGLSHLDQLKFFFSLKKISLSIHTSKKEEFESSQIIDNNYRNIILFPGGNWIPKLWPIRYFNKLIHLLNDHYSNLRFIIVGSIDEKKMYFDDIKKDLSSDLFIDLMGKNLTETSAYMNKSDLFIGNDSGLMHLSVASNLKTIALFGPTNDKIYGHRNSNSFILRTKKNFEEFDRNKIDTTKSHMLSITPEAVLDCIIENKLL